MKDTRAHYTYFKPSGTFYAEGHGATIPHGHTEALTHEFLRELNNGHLPGITDQTDYFTVIVFDPTSWPRCVYAQSRVEVKP